MKRFLSASILILGLMAGANATAATEGNGYTYIGGNGTCIAPSGLVKDYVEIHALGRGTDGKTHYACHYWRGRPIKGKTANLRVSEIGSFSTVDFYVNVSGLRRSFWFTPEVCNGSGICDSVQKMPSEQNKGHTYGYKQFEAHRFPVKGVGLKIHGL